MSEKKIVNNSKNLIVCFGGMALQMGQILPFEFLNYLSDTYKKNELDKYFFIDKEQCWYHKGIKGITSNIDETANYLKNIIQKGNYKKVIFMGVSAGGYAAILFGSLCNVSNVIAFIPRTMYHKKMTDEKYFNIKDYINKGTKYTLYGNLNEKNINSSHHISQCENLEEFLNVNVIRLEKLNMKTLRDNGTIKQIIDNIIF